MLIGLTGGVATGKDLVSCELKRLGAIIIDADAVARDVLRRDKPAYKAVVKAFGKDIALPDGSLDRKTLGEIVFSDKKKLEKLNSLTHPAIRKEMERRIRLARRKSPDAIIIAVVPLLIENKLHEKWVDKTIVVYTNKKNQVIRLMKKAGLTKKEALQRINSQMPTKEKRSLADFVINNNKDKKTTLAQTRKLYVEINRSSALQGCDTCQG
ncbi:MAG: dephospho-CoA kinase [Thermodesulfobacteriota bacterium]